MSLRYGEQSDPWNWGTDENFGQEGSQNADSNFWAQSNVPTQNRNFPHASKEFRSGPPQDHTFVQSGAEYFESVELKPHGQNYAPHPPRAWPQEISYQQEPESYLVSTKYERSNNNSATEVENREIAPPDSKYSKAQLNYKPLQEVEPKTKYLPPKSDESGVKPPAPTSQVGFTTIHQSANTYSMFTPVATSSPGGTHIPSNPTLVPPNPALSERLFEAPPLQTVMTASVQQERKSPALNDVDPSLHSTNQNLPQNVMLMPSTQVSMPYAHPQLSSNSFQNVQRFTPTSNTDAFPNAQRCTPTPPQAPTPPVSLGQSVANNNAQQATHSIIPNQAPLQRASYHVPELENVLVPTSTFNQNSQSIHSSFRPPSPQFALSSSMSGTQGPANIPENQERIPENRERLDNTEELLQQFSNVSIKQVDSEKLQHCSLDRNQYLETGQLSINNNFTGGVGNIEITDEGEAPPPGLHRLVTGQGYENQEKIVEAQSIFAQAETSLQPEDSSCHSSPISSVGETDIRRGQSETEGEMESTNRRQGGELARLVPGQSIGDDSNSVREVPGEAEPLQGRVVLGQINQVENAATQDPAMARGERDSRERERERDRDGERMVGRMVLGEIRTNKQSQNQTNPERQSRHRHRHRRESSFDEEERDYSSERDRRHEEYRRRDDRHRRRRETRSPEYRSEEEFEDRRGYSRSGREGRERRMHERDYSPEYYRERDYYRDSHRRSRRYDHYRDYEEEYYYRENRSRPTSRTGSDYRRSNMDYHPRHTSSRPYFPDRASPAQQIREYEMNMKEYLEKLRRTNPMEYTAWYNQYLNRSNIQQSSSFSNDRASVHSGQSSSNLRHGTYKSAASPNDAVDSVVPGDDAVANDDFAPRLYSTAHVRASWDSHGRLIVVDPHYPVDGQRPTVQICKVGPTYVDQDTYDFLESPGPFIPGITHRNTVLQYLKKMSDRASGSSEKLLYDLIHLTVKANGVVNGSDVSELLMESYKHSGYEDSEKKTNYPPQQLTDAEVISRFRELLQQGNKTEALEWAMANKAWGHALFLASKMDDRTHNNIMLRFANSLPHNDPLQTLYQLMSGHVPQASTCCADKHWSDWRPHLAMILSNPTSNPTLDRKAIITLGDSLGARGRLFASHFCYVTAQVEFSYFQPDAKLVLLGSSSNQEFRKFATCRAIMLSLCYEYGLKLNLPTYSIPTLQLYKLQLASRLIDNNKGQVALQYYELLANEMCDSAYIDKELASTTIEMAERLKMFDPTIALSGDVEREPEWLSKLKRVYRNLPDDYEPQILAHGASTSTLSEIGPEMAPRETGYQAPEQLNSMPYMEPQNLGYAPPEDTYGKSQSLPPQTQPEVYSQEDQHRFQPSYMQPHSLQPDFNGYQTELSRIDAVGGGHEKYWENGSVTNVETHKPADSPQVSVKSGFSFYKSTDQMKAVLDSNASIVKAPKDPDVNESKSKEVKKSDKASKKKDEQPTSGWLGGIWEKLALRPKNQMRLPDDSNPSIVWDKDLNRWVNLEGDDDEKPELKPPPRVNELPMKPSNPGPVTQAAAAPQPVNKYKLQKGKLMKSNYVNVMGGSSQQNLNPGPKEIEGLLPSAPNPPTGTSLFVPPPVEANDNPIDFITPAGSTTVGGVSDPKDLSPSSSMSSLSQEVQFYMNRKSYPSQYSMKQPPVMYNPAHFPS